MKRIREHNLHYRLLVYVLGLFIAAIGVAFAVNSALGVSPVNSTPYVLSRITGLYQGTWVTIMFSFFILLQFLVLRRDFKPIQLAQLPASFLMGYFVNFSRALLGDFRLPTYWGQLAFLGLSIVFLAIGITLFMSARVFPLPPEGFVDIVVEKLNRSRFSTGKIVLDSALALTALLLSLLFLGGIIGVREGTVITALLLGKTIPLVQRVTNPLLGKLGIPPMS